MLGCCLVLGIFALCRLAIKCALIFVLINLPCQNLVAQGYRVPTSRSGGREIDSQLRGHSYILRSSVLTSAQEKQKGL